MRRKYTSDTPLNVVFVPTVQLQKDDEFELDVTYNTTAKQYEHFLTVKTYRYPVTHRTYGRIIDRSISL